MTTGAWKDNKAIIVKLIVGNSNQGIMAAAVVPAQHPLGSALGKKEAQNALP